MPNVIVTPVSERDDDDYQLRTYFLALAGTVSQTFTYPTSQDSLTIRNKSETDTVTVTVNGTVYTVAKSSSQTVVASFTSFDIYASANSQAFEATATVVNSYNQFGALKADNATVVTLIKKDLSLTDDSSMIQNAINSGGNFLLIGNFTISSAIKIKDNTVITFSKGSSITLNNNANSYVFRNDDLVNGNKNITIQNFSIYANGANQTRNFTGGAVGGYVGFGLFFNKVDKLKILDGYMENTNSWSLAHFACTNFEFKRIRFYQTVANFSLNQDGITGTSSYGVIEDIRGFTGDDLVGVSSSGGSLGAGSTGMPDIQVSNVVIRNIYPEKNGTYGAPRAVALYSRSSFPVKDIVIENVKGYTNGQLIFILNAWPSQPDGVFDNIKIRNLQRYNDADTSNTEVVTLGLGKYGTITIEKVQDNNYSSQSKSLVYIQDTAIIDNLILNDIMMVNNNATLGISTVKLDSTTANVKNIFASNCILVNAGGFSRDSIIYKPQANPNLTTVYAQNIKSSSDEILCAALNCNLAANAPFAKGLVSTLTGVEGHTIVDTSDLTRKTFSHGLWDHQTTALTLSGAWVNFDATNLPVAYKIGSMVYCRGLIQSGLVGSPNVITVLPTNLRPSKTLQSVVVTNAGLGMVTIRPSGNIEVANGSLPGNAPLSLDNIAFSLL